MDPASEHFSPTSSCSLLPTVSGRIPLLRSLHSLPPLLPRIDALTLLHKARFFALPSCPCPIVWCTYQHKPRGFLLRQLSATAFNCLSPPPPLPLAFHPYLDRVASLARRREPVPVHSALLQPIQSLPGLVHSTRRHCAFPNRFLLVVIQHHTSHA